VKQPTPGHQTVYAPVQLRVGEPLLAAGDELLIHQGGTVTPQSSAHQAHQRVHLGIRWRGPAVVPVRSPVVVTLLVAALVISMHLMAMAGLAFARVVGFPGDWDGFAADGRPHWLQAAVHRN
jgi:hypothetical protein